MTENGVPLTFANAAEMRRVRRALLRLTEIVEILRFVHSAAMSYLQNPTRKWAESAIHEIEQRTRVGKP